MLSTSNNSSSLSQIVNLSIHQQLWSFRHRYSSVLILPSGNGSGWTVLSLIKIMLLLTTTAVILSLTILNERFLSVLFIKFRNIKVCHSFGIVLLGLVLIYFSKLLRRIAVTHWKKLLCILEIAIVYDSMGFRSHTHIRRFSADIN